MRIGILFLAAAAIPLLAQEPALPPSLEALSARATESVRVSLDGPLLQLAAKMVPDDDEHANAVRKIVAGLQGIYVRNFEFESENVYNPADLEAIRADFRDPSWSRIVWIKSKADGDIDIYFRGAAQGKFAGIAVIAAEPRQFTFVRVVGDITPQQLIELSGEFNIPHLKGKKHSNQKDDDQ